jgi:hypothetical protein
VMSTTIDGEEAHFLVGDTKRPCDWGAVGLARPEGNDPSRCVRLRAIGPVHLPPPFVHIALEGEAAARVIAERMLVARNGSVSERLWRLVVGDEHPEGAREIDARWLGEVPAVVWDVVRDAVLRCT